MSTAIQLIVLIFGAIFAGVGIALFAKHGISRQNTIKVAGVEFQLAGSSLAVFVVGCGLIVLAARMQTFSKEGTKVQPFTESPTVVPPTQASPPGFAEQFVYKEQMISLNYLSYNIRQFPTLDSLGFVEVTRVAFGRDLRGHQIFQIGLTITNTSEDPIVLAPKKAFFSLEGKTGPATLLYFCCSPQSSELLPSRQKRKFLLLFQSSGLYRGEDMLFRVQDLLPIQRETWQFSRHAR